MKTVIGIIGQSGAGKDTAAEYIHDKYKIPSYQISGMLAEIASKQGLQTDSEALANLSRDLSREHGDDYIARIVLERIDNIGMIIGMRQLGQINYLRENTHLLLLAIDADPKIRFERVKERRRHGDPSDLEGFLKIEDQDNNQDVQKASECMKLADYTIKNNDHEPKRLYSRIDQILKKEKISKR